jgi:hypothetical protein
VPGLPETLGSGDDGTRGADTVDIVRREDFPMSIDEPPQVAMEEATAHLLPLAFMEIRFLASPLIEDQSLEALVKRRDQINELADICHGLPGLLGPERRHLLADGLRYRWRTSSARKRQWIRSRWDHLGYDYGWLARSDSAEDHPPGTAAEDAEPDPADREQTA